MEDILFVITFVFGTLKLLTRTRLFDIKFDSMVSALLAVQRESWFTKWLDYAVYIASLGYQTMFFYQLLK